MDKILTVLICNHNHGQYIARCLQGLALQTLDKNLWSILWIHNACTDGSEEILNRLIADDEISEFKLPKIKVMTVPEKRGLAYVKNRGLKEIETGFIAYQDVDDTSMSDRLQMQLDSFQATRCDIIGTQAFDLYPNGQMRINCFAIGQYQYDNEIKARLPVENVMCHGSIMARKEVLDNLGGYRESEDCKSREDHDLWLRAANGGYKFYNVPERLYCYSMNTSVER